MRLEMKKFHVAPRKKNLNYGICPLFTNCACYWEIYEKKLNEIFWGAGGHAEKVIWRNLNQREGTRFSVWI